MKKLFKKILACCLVVCMVFTLCISAVTVSAEEATFDGALTIGNAEVAAGAKEATVSFTALAEKDGIAAAEVNVTLPAGATGISKVELVKADENVQVTFGVSEGKPLVELPGENPEDPDGADVYVYEGDVNIIENVFSYILWVYNYDVEVTKVATTVEITFVGDFSKTAPVNATIEACKNDVDLLNLQVVEGAITVKEAGCKHTETEEIPAVPATCTEPGSTAGEKCSVCGTVITAPTATEALGHDWGEGVIDPDATCTKEGVITYTCTRCPETKTEVINVKDHTPAAEKVKKDEVAATCTTDGSYRDVVVCEVCGAEISSETIPVKALGHKEVYTNNGDNHTVTCSNGCDMNVTEDHSFVDGECVCGAVEGPAEIAVDEAITFRDFKVSIGACLEMKIRVTKSTIDKKYASYDLVVVPTKYDRTVGNAYNEVVLEPIVLEDDPTENYSVYKYTDIAMYELGLTMDVYVRCYDANRNIVATSTVQTVSAEQKLMEEYNKTTATAKLKNVVADLLNMGAKAQIFFGYRNKSSKLYADLIDPNKNILVNRNIDENDLTVSYGELPDEIPADWNPESEITVDTNRMATGLSADKAPIPTFTIYKGTSLTRSDIKLRVVYTSNKGTEYDFEVSGEELRVSGTKLVYNCDVLAYYDTNVNVSVTFTYAGTEVWTQQYSVETGVKANLGSSDANLVSLVDAIAKFGISARNYTGYGVAAS